MGADRTLRLAGVWSLYSADPRGGAAPIATGIEAPATVAGVLRAAGEWDVFDGRDFDAQEWWWRGSFVTPAPVTGEPWTLHTGGLATLVDVVFDGRELFRSEDMFLAHDAPVGDLEAGEHEVLLRCAPLTDALSARRPRPRWRTRLVRHQNLRWFRTTLLGRIPGWSATGAAVGPWREVELVRGPSIVRRDVRVELDGEDGLVTVDVVLRGVPAGAASVVCGAAEAPAIAEVTADGVRVTGTVRVVAPQHWWPHTHGAQPLYQLTVAVGDDDIDFGRVGFRSVEVDRTDGAFALGVNGVAVFCRGATWTPIDPVTLSATPDAMHSAIDDVCRVGFNMLRISGTMAPESDLFYDLCDERGLLVWHDVMLANMDPPDDPDFVAAVEAEVVQLLGRLGGRPALAVVCGGSEIEQQAAMLGLPREQWGMPLVHERVPALVEAAIPGLTYVPSTPTGGALPFHADRGVSHYYGVGAYKRPLADVRRAGVRFAAECLAFANVPVEDLVDDQFGGPAAAGHDPRWKRAVPRDSGVAWDFEDVRYHYVDELFGVQSRELRYGDPARALDLGRVATGELMAATFAEWRRPGSGCGGGLVWFLRDLCPGAGWGIVDSQGTPKTTWWYLRRVLAPISVFVSDEGLNGLYVHVANDTAVDVDAVVRIELFTRGELKIETVSTGLRVAAHGAETIVADSVFEGFRDLTWSYRFGPCAYDVVAVALLDANTDKVLGRTTYLPLGAGRPQESDVGLTAIATARDGGAFDLTVRARRFAQAVCLDVPGWRPSDNWFDLPPVTDYVVTLEPLTPEATGPSGSVRAFNAIVPARIEVR